MNDTNRTNAAPTVLLPPDESSTRRIKRSRVLSYVLVALAAVVLSLRPDLFGDPQSQPVHALLHVGRIVAGIVLAATALAVQVVVGVQWRRSLHTTREAPGNRTSADR